MTVRTFRSDVYAIIEDPARRPGADVKEEGGISPPEKKRVGKRDRSESRRRENERGKDSGGGGVGRARIKQGW